MKATTFLEFIIIVLVVAILLGLLGNVILAIIVKADIGHYLLSTFTGCGREQQECCPGSWCNTGLICSNNACIVNSSYFIMIDETYLYKNPETANRSQRDNYFWNLAGIGNKSCTDAASCTQCKKLYNFRQATNCLDCSSCDSNHTTCVSCLSCGSAEGGAYGDLLQCNNCGDCNNINLGMADSCNSCSYCDIANETMSNPYPTSASCGNCFLCDAANCYSCYNCSVGEEEVCGQCQAVPGTTKCEVKDDNNFCAKIKECIATYNGEPCEIEGLLPLPWSNNPFGVGELYFFNINKLPEYILSTCLKENVMNYLPEGGQQKVCNYDFKLLGDVDNDCQITNNDLIICQAASGSRPGGPRWNPACDFNNDGKIDINDIAIITRGLGKTCWTGGTFQENYFRSWQDFPGSTPPPNPYALLTGPSMTGENEGILFNDCGDKRIPSTLPSSPFIPTMNFLYPETFKTFGLTQTTPKTDEGDFPVNFKIVVNNVSWNENYDNNCSYDIYLCPQEAIAENENDLILNIYRFFAYFNETDHTFTKQNWTYMSPSGDEVNVTGIKFDDKFAINLSGRDATPEHIAKAVVAGFRDYVIMNAIDNQTVKFFCLLSGLHSSQDDCYTNSTYLVINDKAPWKLTRNVVFPIDTLLSFPYYKRIYTDLIYPPAQDNVTISVTFFAFTSNITGINNTIFISPIITLESSTPPVIVPHTLTFISEVDKYGDSVTGVDVNVNGVVKNTLGSNTITFSVNPGPTTIIVNPLAGSRVFSHFWDTDCDQSSSGQWLDIEGSPIGTYSFDMPDRDKTLYGWYKIFTSITDTSNVPDRFEYDGTYIKGKLLDERNNQLSQVGNVHNFCTPSTEVNKTAIDRDIVLEYSNDNGANWNLINTAPKFSDDFNDNNLVGWVKNGNWNVTDGELNDTATGDEIINTTWNGWNSNNYASVNVKINSPITGSDVWFRLVNGSGYSIYMQINPPGNSLHLYYTTNTVWQLETSAFLPPVFTSNPNDWHNWKIVQNGNNVKCYIDDVLLIDDNVPIDVTNGKIQLRVLTNLPGTFTNATFDDITVDGVIYYKDGSWSYPWQCAGGTNMLKASYNPLNWYYVGTSATIATSCAGAGCSGPNDICGAEGTKAECESCGCTWDAILSWCRGRHSCSSMSQIECDACDICTWNA